MSHLDAYILRYGDFCAHDTDNYVYDNGTTTPCACAQGRVKAHCQKFGHLCLCLVGTVGE